MLKNKSIYLRYALMGACLFIPALAFGQASDASAILNETHRQLLDMSGLIVNIVSIVIGLVGIAMLAVNLPKYFKGDPTSNDALIKIGGGLLIAVVILQIIRMTLLR